MKKTDPIFFAAEKLAAEKKLAYVALPCEPEHDAPIFVASLVSRRTKWSSRTRRTRWTPGTSPPRTPTACCRRRRRTGTSS